MPIDALSVLCAQLTRDLLAIAKFLFIETMFLYVKPFMEATIFNSNVFSVKEWRDLETEGRGHSRSLKMAPFDRSLCDFGRPL